MYWTDRTVFLDDFDLRCYCLCICPEVWLAIFKFLHVRYLVNLRLVNRKFCYITSLHKKVKKFSNFSKKIFKIEILTEIKSFLKNLIDELKLHFNFNDLIYFSYCLSFFDFFDLGQFLLHLFFYIFQLNWTFFRLVIAKSVFPPDLLEEFILQKNDQFRCNVFYESESKYQIIKSCEERCMKFIVAMNPTNLIISSFEVFVRFFCNFFYNLSKDCLLLSKKQASDIDKRENCLCTYKRCWLSFFLHYNY